ncbi:MAG TPA: iron ABC transporter permease [Sulfuricurvum sp.]|nr:MAG: iron ABC transporter permease [Campylobacterales bacterium 16-40-21]OZA03126.1 MAG: iron ABC transporter permease [Sulfuricurvum sp. 17-40-25]HQS67068.1 iron ABC transporter permease [Sulfuricurvum sp.]HQT36724.1 iron ABC transporter permease [Sulfuricurvum sp.]
MKLTILIGALILLSVSAFMGETQLDIQKILDPDAIEYLLFWDLRAPRVVVAFSSGAILALGGLVFQAVFRNSLTTPFTLGVSSGATLATAFGIIFLPASLVAFSSIFSFFGAFSTVLLLFLFARVLNTMQTGSLLLIGIALSFFYSAALMVLYYISDLQQSYSIIRFTMGSLNVVGFTHVYAVIAAAFLLLGVTLRYKHELRLILTSYDNAFLKGIEIKKINLILLFFVSISVGVSVSVVGPIGFVGLVIPHVIKLIYKQSSDKLILPVFFYGGVFLVLCDLIARNLGTVSEIPIGVVTSFVGGPFFIYLIGKRKNSNG